MKLCGTYEYSIGAFVKSLVHLDVLNVDNAINGELKCAASPKYALN